jgi:hypothetical protein
MVNLKTYEGFFDFFKKKDSEDDKIALTFIDRLGKVKAISPYDIKVIVSEHGEAGKLTKFIVTFDDLVLIVKQADFSKPYPDNKRYRYNISVECSGDYEKSVECSGDYEKVKCREKYERDLFNLINRVYKRDIEARRLNRIKSEINPSADLID